MENVLLSSFDETPFAKTSPKDFIPAFNKWLKAAQKEVEAIANQTTTPTFKNTVEALEFSGMPLHRISAFFFNINSAHTSPEIQKIAQEIAPKLSHFKNEILFNGALFKRIEHVYKTSEKSALTPEQHRLLTQQYLGFYRNGATLPLKQKDQLKTISAKLTTLSLQFGENVLAETNAFILHITDKQELEGLPESVMTQAALTAKAQQKQGWVFTLDYPSYVPFLTYAANRSLRQKMFKAFTSRATKGERSNLKLVQEIAALRYQKARLLGYKTFADLVLEERMAAHPKAVIDFLETLLEKAMPKAQEELNTLEAFAKKLEGINKLERWDTAYYAEKLKEERYQLNDELLKPYFELYSVLEGVFTISKKLFGLDFKKRTQSTAYHEDVNTFDVFDDQGNLAAVLYTDFHPRPSKRDGAWMTAYKPQFNKNGVNERPHISIVCNFAKATPNKPALLSFQEVTTLFHEMGHALHGILANTIYPHLSGTNVFWDFVELPSQFMENWCYEAESLNYFAKHYKTGEPIPMHYIKSIKEAAQFNQGMQTVRQIGLGLLDMAWHNTNPTEISDVLAYEQEVLKRTNLLPEVSTACTSASFSHLFQGGYAAGYYSYKWAEVLDADAFAYFKAKGLFHKNTSQKFKTLLSKGGTENPMQLYKTFRGKQPTIDALLERVGWK